MLRTDFQPRKSPLRPFLKGNYALTYCWRKGYWGQTPWLCALLLLVAVLSVAEADDSFYSGGQRHTLVRVPGLRAVGLEKAESSGKDLLNSFSSGTLVEAWERHNLVIVKIESGSCSVGVKTTQPGIRWENPVFDYGAGRFLVVTDELIASFSPSLGRKEIEAIVTRRGAVVDRGIAYPSHTYVLRAARDTELAALRVANTLVEEGEVLFAHPNFVACKRKRFTPNDPHASNQWHLCNLGQNGAKPGEDVDACAAWDITRGSADVTIAVIDDGVELNHEDFQGDTFVPGHDFYSEDDDPNPVPENRDYHGTAVAGIIAANGDNGIGVTGVAPGCRIMPVRLAAGETSDEQDAAAIHWASEQGAWIINNSWGPPDGNPLTEGDEIHYPLPDIVRAAIDYAADRGRGGKGCLIFWAAGNGNEPVSYDGYASYEKVIAVGACDDQGERAYYSDYGPELDLCAPSDGGETAGIWTTDLMGERGYNDGSPYEKGDAAGNYVNDFGGTSAAAPIAAGVAALLLSREPMLTREEAMRRLAATADRIDRYQARYDLTGHSITHGYGRVNARSTLTRRTRHPRLRLEANSSLYREGDGFSLFYTLYSGRSDALNRSDIYLALFPPAGMPLFLRNNFAFSHSVMPFMSFFTMFEAEGRLGQGITLSGLVPGDYTIYAVAVTPDMPPYNPAHWLHSPASLSFSFEP